MKWAEPKPAFGTHKARLFMNKLRTNDIIALAGKRLANRLRQPFSLLETLVALLGPRPDSGDKVELTTEEIAEYLSKVRRSKATINWVLDNMMLLGATVRGNRRPVEPKDLGKLAVAKLKEPTASIPVVIAEYKTNNPPFLLNIRAFTP